jgi:hypothetical protein
MPELWQLIVGTTPAPEVAQVLADVGYGTEPGETNIEELLSRCDALAQIRSDPGAAAFRGRAIAQILERCRRIQTDRASLRAHMEFLRRISRRRARDSRAQLFTTNYDIAFERAASHLGFIPLDGFSFSSPRRFDARFFDYDIVKRAGEDSEPTGFIPGVFQYAKLHGSVDWQSGPDGTTINEAVAAKDAALIYPTRAKYQLSYQQPHLELMARFLACLREPNTCLVVLGFGFNDAHVTAPVLAALVSSHLRVVVVSPSAETSLTNPTHESWIELAARSGHSDLAFMAGKFDEFVELIPDLRALNSAEVLERAVRGTVGRR